MPTNIAARAGRWSATHRRKAILGWLAFVVVATLVGGSIGTRTLDRADEGNGQSQVAERAIAAAGFPDDADEQVLIQGRGPVRAADPAFARATHDVVTRLREVAYVGDVQSPLNPANAGQLSHDGRSALVTFKLAGDEDAIVDRVDASLAATAAVQQAHPQVRIEQFGSASAGKALGDVLADDFAKAERVSLPITLLILLVAFGAFVAAGLPLLLGLTAVIGTIGLLGPVSQLSALTDQVNVVVLLIGLAVGVDYSMFYLRREMEERAAGRSASAALAAAAATSGRAVLTSGLTVMIAMGGMFLAGNATYVSFAIGTILVVAVAVVGSLTFLPAMLAWLGEKGWTEKGRVPWVGRRRLGQAGESRMWGAIIDRVLRRPLLSAVAATALLVALAVPALGLKTITAGVQGIPRDIAVMQTYDRIQAAFPGGPLPATVAVQAPDVTAPAVQRGIERLRSAALATRMMSEPVGVTVNPAKTLALVSIPLRGTGTDAVSNAALARLRDDVIPATVGAVAGTQTHVTGTTAMSKDVNDSLAAHLPLVFGFVLTLAFALLLVTFRSIVIPMQAIVLNLLSVGASYGVLKLVFQDGHGEGLLGFQSIGGVVSWLPLFLFVILFGLSMDYHVFIVSRIREAFDGGMSTEDAIAHGIKSTAGVVTSAAVVMVAVFGVFASLSIMDFKQMGVGLGVAILIDATIVRGVLLPATMKLLGDWNWYLPTTLRRSGTPQVERPLKSATA
ncbi:MAG: MMPL family transporter [Solirubrobacteraceae bacterium]|nr:MMPL family transporter [Solirubrobacteraceae bacterium]